MAVSQYLNFDVQIERTGEQYRARVIDSPTGQAAHTFDWPFSPHELEKLVARLRPGGRRVRAFQSAEMEAAKELGGRLYDTVFAADVRACLGRSLDEANRQGVGLRIRLRLTDAPEFVNVPWEFLYNAPLNRFLALSGDTPLIRYLDVPEPIRPLAVKPPLRILVMIASPPGYAALDVETEWTRLRTALADLEDGGLVTLELLPSATLGALQKTLRQREYHIFHFIGHGTFDEVSQDGLLLMTDEDGRPRAVSSQNLSTVLHDYRSLRLAVLNACEGARSAAQDPFAGVAQELVRQRLPAVIAMQFEISDEAAVTLSHEFYLALAEGYPVDAALAQARRAIYTQAADVEWGTPVLYLRSPDGRIFDVTALTDADRRRAQQIKALTVRAQQSMADRDWSAARAAWRAILNLDPQHPAAMLGYEEAGRQRRVAELVIAAADARTGGDRAALTAALTELIELDPGNVDAIAELEETQRAFEQQGRLAVTPQRVPPTGAAEPQPPTAATPVRAPAAGATAAPTDQKQSSWLTAAPARGRRLTMAIALGGLLFVIAVAVVIRWQTGLLNSNVRPAESTTQAAPSADVTKEESADITPRTPASEYDPEQPAAISSLVTLAPHELLRIGRGRATSVRIAPDSQTLAVATAVGVWLYRLDEPDAGRLLPHDAVIHAVDWSPDGSQVAGSAEDGTILIWDAASGEVVHTLRENDSPGPGLAWSPDGRQLAATSYNGAVSIWNVSDESPARALPGENGYTTDVTWSPDGTQLAVGYDDSTIRIWNAETGEPVKEIKGHEHRVSSVAWSPDGRKLASGSPDGTVRLWDVESGAEQHRFGGHGSEVFGVAWSPDGTQLVSGGGDNTVRIWNAEAHAEIRVLEGHTHWVLSVAWAKDGSKIVSASEDGTVRLWDPSNSEAIHVFAGHNVAVQSVAWSPDSPRVINALPYSPVTIWDADTGVLVQTLEGQISGGPVMAWSPDGSKIAGGSYDNTVRLWDAESGELLHTLEGHEDSVLGLAWSPDGAYIASASEDKTVRIWSAGEGKLEHTLEEHTDVVYAVAWSPDGERLISTGADGPHLWDPRAGSEVSASAPVPPSRVIAWSPNGLFVASESNYDVLIWDSPDAVEPRTLKGHESSVTSIAWSPNSERLASGSWDGAIRIWEAGSGQQLKVLEGHGSGVLSVSWSPDGTRLVSGSDDGTLRVWEVE